MYEIKSQLGEGGMGVVFRALDTKLQREVALKLLPPHVASDSDRLARFQREAQVLASLNHPNIAQIHGLEDSTPQTCIVMELVDGQTLQERLRRGPIPWTELMPIAKQICEALDAAHERGIVHRDLKPANIKLTPAGTVKVLDFGLAKAIENTAPSASVSNSPTVSMAATNAGVILGTAPYMSPEQAKGRAVDRRTDIFAFGCVLFEMLTGRPAFDGDDVTEIIGRVVAAEPDWNKLPGDAPPTIHRLIRRALRKDPRQRLSDIRDARLEIEEAANELQPAAARTSRTAGVIAAAAAVIAVLLAIPAIRHFSEKPVADAPEMRLEITTPPTPVPLEFELSPDGRMLAFIASENGAQRLWLRALDKTEAQPLSGTEGADYPFWSPDNRSIGFYVNGKLKRIDVSGGTPQTLANASASFGGTWNADGAIIFSSITGPLSRVSAAGGTAAPVTKLRPQQAQHRFPKFLPDGRHFVFFVAGAPEVTGIYLGSLDNLESKRLTDADSTGVFLPPDMLAFGRASTLMARHLDLQRGELTGDPIRLGDFVAAAIQGLTGLSISKDGLIAYRTRAEVLRQLNWYDRNGKAIGTAGEKDPNAPLYPELSPDGRRVAMMRTLQGNSDVWFLDLMRGGLTRFTFDTAVDLAPVWSPDGTKVVFTSNRKGPYNIYIKQAGGAASEELLVESMNNKYPQDWSSDGKFFLYGEVYPTTGRDLLALPVNGPDQKPITIANTPFDEQNGQFSPDGHFVAYQTNDSGIFQIFVQPFPQATGKWQVSTAGGSQPRWRADGKELYFFSPDGKIMAAATTLQGSTFNAGTPVALFSASLVSGLGANKQEYAVSRDGRFLLNQPSEEGTLSPITLILNWKLKP
jgi:Tol biopolymer transport system component